MAIPEAAPTGPAVSAEAVPPAPWFRKRRNLIGLGLAVLAAAGTAAGLFLVGASSPAAITIHGTLSIGGMANDNGSDPMSPVDGDPCTGIGGYGDITAGKTVTVSGSTGQVLTVTGLTAGVETDLPADATLATGNCVFSFSAQVPAGESSYTVSISGRGSQTFTAAQGEAGVSLVLG
jgi:hypothetical protein